MKKVKLYSILFGLLLLLSKSFAFESTQQFHHSSHLGNYPTAIPIKKFHLETKIYLSPGGIIHLSSSYGLGDFFSFGGTWGVDSLISNKKIHYSLPQVTFKYTIFFEGNYVPAVSIGYEDIGRQNLFSTIIQHDYFKSRGLYLAFSKYFFFFRRPFSMTAGINYSWIDNRSENYNIQLRPDDPRKGDNDFTNGYFSSDFLVSHIFSFYGIYNLALDDNLSHNPFKGYLNFGIRFHLGNLSLNIEFQDILKNKIIYTNDGKEEKQKSRREINIFYLYNI